MLSAFGAHNYDKVEDLNQLKLNVEKAMTDLKIKWRTQDEQKLKY